MNKKINVSLIGLGTVGQGVYDILKNNDYLINQKVRLYAVCDKDVTKKEKVTDVLFIEDYNDIINDPNVDIVVEMIGGENLAYKVIKQSLINKKSVVTSNKEVVSLHLDEFYKLAKENEVYFLFEAAVGGGVPIINNLCNYASLNEINKVGGILNGSTNYILTKIQGLDGEKISLKDALSLAFENGFLEKDPANDLKGLDMIRKVAILSDLAFHTFVDIKDIYSFSLENIDDEYIDFVNKEGYVLKYIASSVRLQDKLMIKIEPILFSSSSIEANILNELNYISYNGDNIGSLSFTGKGAGKKATATAVASDIYMISEKRGFNDYQNINKYEVVNDDGKKYNYVIKVKDIKKILEEIMIKKENDIIITKKIDRKEINEMQENIIFYARMEDIK